MTQLHTSAMTRKSLPALARFRLLLWGQQLCLCFSSSSLPLPACLTHLSEAGFLWHWISGLSPVCRLPFLFLEFSISIHWGLNYFKFLTICFSHDENLSVALNIAGTKWKFHPPGLSQYRSWPPSWTQIPSISQTLSSVHLPWTKHFL